MGNYPRQGQALPIDKIAHPIDVFDETIQDIESRYGRGKDLSIASLPELDDLIWGFRRQKLVVMAGRPSQGKSTIMGQMALDFARQGKKVYFFSLEMTNKVLMERLICSQLEVDNYFTFTGKYVEVRNLIREKERKLRKEMERLPLILIESVGKTFAEVFDIIETFGKKAQADCVFIDYVNMVKGFSRQSDKQAIDEYIKSLREYAIKRNFCAILGAQINRSTHSKQQSTDGLVPPPQLWELKGTGNLEEVADLAILLHHQFFYNKTEDVNEREYLINIAKNRDGRTGYHKCQFFGEFYKVTEKPKKEEVTDAPRNPKVANDLYTR